MRQGQQFTYTYDSMGRLTQLSLTGTGVLRTYYYDTNPFDSTYSTNANGRLTAVQYTLPNGDADTDMFAYDVSGAITAKRLRVSRVSGGIVYTGDLNASFTFDSEGRPSTVSYPANGPTYTTTYDSMGRPTELTDQANDVLVNNIQYGAAGQVQQISFFGATETRQYNNLLQLTQITANNNGTNALNMAYAYSGTQNNGKITSQTDSSVQPAETVNYAYDSLNRLISAIKSDEGWGQGYSYDSFGNLTAKTVLYGSVPTMSVGVDATTNRLVGYSYDANGNMTTVPAGPWSSSYDAFNRLIMTDTGAYQYGYDWNNKRIWTYTPSGEKYFFHDAAGKQLGRYSFTLGGGAITFEADYKRTYFGGRLVSQDGVHPMIVDRTHSMRVDSSGAPCSFFPYGEERSCTSTDDQVKFETYTRDSGTLLDYADQRYYTWNYGRFMTPDVSKRNVELTSPQSWNGYGYTQGDPVNSYDPTGQNVADFFSTIGSAFGYLGNAVGGFLSDIGDAFGGFFGAGSIPSVTSTFAYNQGPDGTDYGDTNAGASSSGQVAPGPGSTAPQPPSAPTGQAGNSFPLQPQYTNYNFGYNFPFGVGGVVTYTTTPQGQDYLASA